MSKEGDSGNAGGQESGDVGKKDSSDDIYDSHGPKKIIRLITVLAYMFSVSFVAIVLSAYYLFLWKPPNPRLLRRPDFLKADPEIQFLLSDSAVLANQSTDHFEEFSSNNILKEISNLRNHSTEPEKFLDARIADDDTFDMIDFIGKESHLSKPRQLDESLSILRSSLVELLRGQVRLKNTTTTTAPKNETLNLWTFDRTIGLETKTKISGNIPAEKFEKSTANYDVDSTISGDEPNKNHSTSNRNRTVHGTNQNIHRRVFVATPHATGRQDQRRDEMKFDRAMRIENSTNQQTNENTSVNQSISNFIRNFELIDPLKFTKRFNVSSVKLTTSISKGEATQAEKMTTSRSDRVKSVEDEQLQESEGETGNQIPRQKEFLRILTESTESIAISATASTTEQVETVTIGPVSIRPRPANTT